MKILVLNSGSSSIKYQLIDVEAETGRRLAQGEIARIGEPGSARDHDEALQQVFGDLRRSGESLDEIQGVGHRIVHGADRFSRSVVIDAEVLRLIESVSPLAPLHNPANLKGVYAAKTLLPYATQVAVFDTAFHHTLPPKAFLYGLPYEYYERRKIRRYGFHGTAHRWLAMRFAEIRGTAPESQKVITCQLGNGCSVCAIEGGRSADTSMGFTPLEGLLMGTRAGDIDAGAVTYLMRVEGRDAPAMEDLLNKHSGLAGVSGISNDMRDIEKAAQGGDPRAQQALDVFCYRVTKYIGAYFAALGGADAVVFGGGIGENAPEIRRRICAPLEAIGIRLDNGKNQRAVGKEQEIGEAGVKPAVWVIPTDEEMVIARDTWAEIVKRPA